MYVQKELPVDKYEIHRLPSTPSRNERAIYTCIRCRDFENSSSFNFRLYRKDQEVEFVCKFLIVEVVQITPSKSW